jgi:hypothetical protein
MACKSPAIWPENTKYLLQLELIESTKNEQSFFQVPKLFVKDNDLSSYIVYRYKVNWT